MRNHTEFLRRKTSFFDFNIFTFPGDASSPHGATCSIQFSTSSSPSSSGTTTLLTASNHSSNNTTTATYSNLTSSSTSNNNQNNNSSSSSTGSSAGQQHQMTALTSTPSGGVDSGGSKTPSPSLSPAGTGTGNEGLTRQQLDLITQIMQQTKQANAAVAAAAAAGQKIPPRPRTWNMQVSVFAIKKSFYGTLTDGLFCFANNRIGFLSNSQTSAP